MPVLIAVRRGGLGDLLVVLPSLRLLRAAFPQTRIVLVCRPAYGRLPAAAGVVDAVEDEGDFRWAVLASPEAAAKAAGGPALPPADLIAGWFHSPAAGDFRSAAAALWPNAEIRAFTSDPAAGLPLNRSFFEQTAAAFPGEGRRSASFENFARLPVPARKDAAARRDRFPAEPYVVVHPGSGSRDKLWPGDRFREIVRRAAEAGYSGAVVLGEAEEALRAEWTVWSKTERPDGWTLIDRPPLEDLAELLAGASFYWGNDSGPTHLAAVLGTRGAAAFKEAFARAWNPGGRIAVIPAPDVREISVSAMLRFFVRDCGGAAASIRRP